VVRLSQLAQFIVLNVDIKYEKRCNKRTIYVNCFKNALRLVDPEIDFKFYSDIKLRLAMVYDFLRKTDKALAQFDDLIDRQS